MNLSKYLLMAAVCICCISCNTGKPKHVLDKKQMTEALYQVILHDEFVTSYELKNNPTPTKQIRQEAFAKALDTSKISFDVFKRSLSWYENNPTDYKELIDSLVKHATRMKERQYYQAPTSKRIDTSKI
jgi:hypothetical protein